jgi:hypothetical protein
LAPAVWAYEFDRQQMRRLRRDRVLSFRSGRFRKEPSRQESGRMLVGRGKRLAPALSSAPPRGTKSGAFPASHPFACRQTRILPADAWLPNDAPRG